MDDESTDPQPTADQPEWGPDDTQDENLTGSISALAGLSTARLSLEDLLISVATIAVQAIPGADGAGLTLVEAGRSDTIVKTDPFVADIDEIQYRIGEGPCITDWTVPILVDTVGHDRSSRTQGDRR